MHFCHVLWTHVWTVSLLEIPKPSSLQTLLLTLQPALPPGVLERLNLPLTLWRSFSRVLSLYFLVFRFYILVLSLKSLMIFCYPVLILWNYIFIFSNWSLKISCLFHTSLLPYHSYFDCWTSFLLFLKIVSLFVCSFECLGFPDSSVGQESTCNVGDLGLIPGLGRSSGEEKGYPLQYSVLENSKDCIVHGVTKSRTRLSNFHFPLLGLQNHCRQW